MVRRLLVAIDESPYAQAALDEACLIATECDAHITGLAVLSPPSLTAYVGSGPVGSMQYGADLELDLTEQADALANQLTTQFRNHCESRNVHHTVRERRGSAPEAIIYEAMFHDQVVIGLRTHFRFPATDEPDDTLSRVLDRVAAPIYALPAAYEKPDRRRVVLTFNGTLPAARAIQHFTRVIQPATCASVTVLTCTDRQDVAQAHLENAATYLQAHGFTDVEQVWSDGDVREVMADRYLDDADLVVLGANSQRKLVDLVVGSLAKLLIGNATTPLLIG